MPRMFDTLFVLWLTHGLAGLAVNVLLQSTVLILIGVLVARLWRSRAAVESAVLRTTLALVLLCPVVSLLLASAGWSGLGIRLREPMLAAAPAVPAIAVCPAPQPEPVYNPGSDTDRPPLSVELLTPTSVELSATPAMLDRQRLVSPVVTSSAAIEPPPEWWAALYVACAALWGVMVLLLGTRLLLCQLRLRALRNAARPAGPEATEFCASFSRQLGVNTPQVRISSQMASPCLVGIVRPVILLPAGASDRESLGHVLVHELAHLARRDCQWNLLGRVLATLFPFQPLIGLLSRRMEESSDHVCDDYVVEHGLDRRGYARCLVDLAERIQYGQSETLLGVGMIGTQSALGRRVLRILDKTHPVSLRLTARASMGVVLLGIGATVVFGFVGATSQLPMAVGKTANADTPTATSPADGVVEPSQVPASRPVDSRQRVVATPTTMPQGAGQSLGWHILRQWNAGPLLLNLAPRLAQTLAPSRRDDPIWVGTHDGGQVELELTIEGKAAGEIFVGFFAGADFSGEPVQVRKLPTAGRHLIDGLPTGKFHVGAMAGVSPAVTALGVHRTWPEPIEVTTTPCRVEVLVSSEFFHHASGTSGHDTWMKWYTGQWDSVRPANLLQGRTLGPDGQPVPFATMQIREHKPGARSIAAPDVGTDYSGRYFYDEMEWPYRVGAIRYELLPNSIGFRSQYIAYQKVLRGPQIVDFQFPDWPSGDASVAGRVVNQAGQPVESFFLRVDTWPAYRADYQQDTDKRFCVSNVNVPFMTRDGRFRISGLPAGEYDIRAIAFDVARYGFQRSVEKSLPAGATVEVELTLNEKDVFYGRVVFEDGKPVYADPPPWEGAEASVSLRSSEGGFSYGVGGIDRDGYLTIRLEPDEIERIEAGRSRLTIYYPDTEPRTLRDIGELPFDKLSPQREKAGTVTVSRPRLEEKPRPRPARKEDDTVALVGRMMPDFELLGTDGRTYRLDDFKDRPVLINVFTTWCGPCVQELPHLKELQEEQADGGLVVLSISREEKSAVVEAWAGRERPPFPVLVDEKGPVTRHLQDSKGHVPVPTNVVLDRSHRIVHADRGFTDEKWDQIARTVANVLNDKP